MAENKTVSASMYIGSNKQTVAAGEYTPKPLPNLHINCVLRQPSKDVKAHNLDALPE